MPNENPWQITYKGNLIAIEKHSTKGYERAVRPPGVRLVLKNTEGNLLLTKEFRSEKSALDYRLPGGKVFDDLDSWLAVRADASAMEKAVLAAAKLEAKQEAGIDATESLSILSRSVAGASVEWDLYYVTGTITAMSAQELDGDEVVHGIEVDFYTPEQVLAMLKSGEIAEDRTVGVLFRYLSV